jgi:hypothetical protein
MSAWTFETLAAADREKLEEVVRTGVAPDYGELEGFVYCGWNQQRVARLTGEKFRKVFRRREGRPFGYNEVVRQDRQGYGGKWEPKLENGRPVEIGHFRVANVADEPPRRLYRPYRHGGLFDYNVAVNTGRNFPLRVIRDITALPNPGDHGLVLGKAYLQLGPFHVFYSYFVLGHRRPIAS